jgi:hypothetical protein
MKITDSDEVEKVSIFYKGKKTPMVLKGGGKTHFAVLYLMEKPRFDSKIITEGTATSLSFLVNELLRSHPAIFSALMMGMEGLSRRAASEKGKSGSKKGTKK